MRYFDTYTLAGYNMLHMNELFTVQCLIADTPTRYGVLHMGNSFMVRSFSLVHVLQEYDLFSCLCSASITTGES